MRPRRLPRRRPRWLRRAAAVAAAACAAQGLAVSPAVVRRNVEALLLLFPADRPLAPSFPDLSSTILASPDESLDLLPPTENSRRLLARARAAANRFRNAGDAVTQPSPVTYEEYYRWKIETVDLERLQHLRVPSGDLVAPLIGVPSYRAATAARLIAARSRTAFSVAALAADDAAPVRVLDGVVSRHNSFTGPAKAIQLATLRAALDLFERVREVAVPAPRNNTCSRVAVAAAGFGGGGALAEVLQHPDLFACNCTDRAGDSLLHHAVRHRDSILVPQLLQTSARLAADLFTAVNKRGEDLLHQALTSPDRSLTHETLEALGLKEARHPPLARRRAERLLTAMEQSFPEEDVIKLIQVELSSAAEPSAELCRARDLAGRSVVSMAVDAKYATAAHLFLDYYDAAVTRRAPFWQECNAHAPSSSGVVPLEQFVASDGDFRGDYKLLRRLYASLSPSDGSSSLMMALNLKGNDIILEQLIPPADMHLSLRDLQLHARERAPDQARDNVLALVSRRAKSGRTTVRVALSSLLSAGIVEAVPEAYEALTAGVSIAAQRRDSSLIQTIARTAPRAIQAWYCKKFADWRAMPAASVSRRATFVTGSLPTTFAGFAPVGCRPIFALAQQVLSQPPGTPLDLRGFRTLVSLPAARFSPSSHLRQTLIMTAQ